MKWDKWPELTKYQSEGNALPPAIAALPRSVTIVLIIVARSSPGRVFFELEEIGDTIRSSIVSDVPASPLFAYLTLIYSKTPWTDLGKWLHPLVRLFMILGNHRDSKRLVVITG